jgi:hypothetical protein
MADGEPVPSSYPHRNARVFEPAKTAFRKFAITKKSEGSALPRACLSAHSSRRRSGDPLKFANHRNDHALSHSSWPLHACSTNMAARYSAARASAPRAQ